MKHCVDEYFFVRDASISDICLYKQMLRDNKWLYNSGFDANEFETDEQIERFISKNHPEDIKWICCHSVKGFLGFVHFKVISDKYMITIGGIVPSYLNSGLGIKYFVECIDLYYKLGNQRTLRHNIYQENLRSCKMHIGMGDELVDLKIFGNKKFDVFETNKNTFYNSSLIKRILKI